MCRAIIHDQFTHLHNITQHIYVAYIYNIKSTHDKIYSPSIFEVSGSYFVFITYAYLIYPISAFKESKHTLDVDY